MKRKKATWWDATASINPKDITVAVERKKIKLQRVKVDDLVEQGKYQAYLVLEAI